MNTPTLDALRPRTYDHALEPGFPPVKRPEFTAAMRALLDSGFTAEQARAELSANLNA